MSPGDILTFKRCQSSFYTGTKCVNGGVLVILHLRFPYRMVPRLPPAKLMANIVGVTSDFIEDRRKSLVRWLTIVTSHPVLREDTMIR